MIASEGLRHDVQKKRQGGITHSLLVNSSAISVTGYHFPALPFQYHKTPDRQLLQTQSS